MRHRSGFSLVELLIALALSSIIMIGLVQANRNAAHLLKEAQNLLVVNRQVALLCNQLTRDITASVEYQKPSAYAPFKEVKKGGAAEEKEAPAKSESAAEKKVGSKPEKEKHIPSCTLEAYEEGGYRAGAKKWQQTKKLSLITTTPLDVYEQEHQRLVRVGYELVYDKKRSTPQKSVYILYRQQTDELENHTFKIEEDKKVQTVSRCVVTDHIKQFSLEAAYDERLLAQKDKQPADQEKKEHIKTFNWTEKEEKEKSKTIVPDHFSAHIEMWDTSFVKSYSFTAVFPVLVKKDALPLKEKTGTKQEDKPAKAAAEKGAADEK